MKTKSILLSLVLALSPCLAVSGAEAANFGLQKFAGGFVSPTGFVPVPGQAGLFVVTDQIGVAYAVDKSGKTLDAPFLDLRSKMCQMNKDAFDERGLLSISFHPKFASNHKVYLVYSAPLRKTGPKDWDNTLTLAEFKVSKDGKTADLASEKVLLEIDKPYFNHNGGSTGFGPDGYLYMSVGDGGNGNDEDSAPEAGHEPKNGHTPGLGNGQDTSKLLGKILRIDVDHGQPYSVPKDNPFVGKTGRPEIFAYGMRNSWRMSFDRGGSHELFAADVGQDLFEEVDIIVKGGNFGWNIREGFHCFSSKDTKHPPQDCPKVGANGEPLLDPIFEYKHTTGFGRKPEEKGISITGGFVYRGKAIPQLEGKYVFGDWSRNFIKADGALMAASRSGDGKPWNVEDLAPSTHPKALGMYIVAFGEDADGELYVMTNDSSALKGTSGKVWKFVP